MTTAMTTEERLGHLEKGQDATNEKIDALDRNIGKRMDDTNIRISEGNQRLSNIETKLDNTNISTGSKFDTLTNRIGSKFDTLTNRMDSKFDALTNRMDNLNSRMTAIGILLVIAVIGSAASNILFG